MDKLAPICKKRTLETIQVMIRELTGASGSHRRDT
jgi:hypothetical protein